LFAIVLAIISVQVRVIYLLRYLEWMSVFRC